MYRFFNTLLLVGALTGSTVRLTIAQELPCSHETTNAGMQACESTRYTQARKDLLATYRLLLQQASPAARRKLVVSESAWERFSQAHAAFMMSTADAGTLGPLLQITTLADMTASRTAELKKLLP